MCRAEYGEPLPNQLMISDSGGGTVAVKTYEVRFRHNLNFCWAVTRVRKVFTALQPKKKRRQEQQDTQPTPFFW